MSLTTEKRKEAFIYMLEKIDAKDPELVTKVSDAFGISDKTVYKYLKQLKDEKVIEKKGRSYVLITENHVFNLKGKDIKKDEEEKIFDQWISPLIKDFPANVRSIWIFAFSEMMNNALEHADAKNIKIIVSQNYLKTSIVIEDDGVGIFNKIQNYFHYDSIENAIEELFKGKLTTNTENHSGEGIFFTSRLVDDFAAISSGKIFTHNRFDVIEHKINAVQDISGWDNHKGTIVYLSLSNSSKKVARDIFDQYTDEDGAFTKTSIPLKNIFEYDPVARSQAKRLCARFDSFEEIIIDFEDVDFMGQGFADQIFRIYANAHPSTKITPINENEDVKKMIYHVTHRD